MEPNIDTFQKIYDAWSDAIFRFCLTRTSNREQALDLTQETFLRLWQNIEKGEKIKSEKAFLFTISHRLIIDWYRKKKSISLDKMMENEENPFDPKDETNLEISMEGKYLIENLDKLKSDYRDAIYLRFVEGLSPAEIGMITGTSTNAVSVRINRGLQELREKTGYNINIKEN